MDKNKIAERLKKLRGNKSVETVANELGITPQAVYQYEKGVRIPTDEMKIRIATFYKSSVESIFYE